MAMAETPGDATASAAAPEPQPGDRSLAVRLLRPLAALCCLAVVVLGATHAPLTAAPELRGSSSVGGADGGVRLPWSVTLAVALGLLIVAVVVRRRLHRGRADEPSITRTLPRIAGGRLAGIVTLLGCVVVLLGAAWLLAHLQLAAPASPVAASGAALADQPAPVAQAVGSRGNEGLLIALSTLLVLMLALALALLVRALRLSRRRVAPAVRGRRPALLDAVAAARAELHEDLSGDRAAVIACYETMEVSLRNAGIPRGQAGTATEQLAHAAAEGLIDARAGRTLVAVFHRARFSDHPVAAAHRRVAERALARIEADLASPR